MTSGLQLGDFLYCRLALLMIKWSAILSLFEEAEMNRWLPLLIFVVVVLAGSAILLWSGIYNVAATDPHWKLTRWVLGFARERSIAYHSQGIEAPLSTDAEQIAEGFDQYQAACRLCHGAPGRSSAEFAAGLYPSPPYLPKGEVQKELTRPELFWIVKYGIKMSGMPAFGKHQDDRQIWNIVAFVQKVPGMTADAYGELIQKRSP
jgi:mono/diheme cytochrome c family protein